MTGETSPLLLAGVSLGAALILWTTACLSRPAARLQGVVVGAAGLGCGALASFAYTMTWVLRGIDIDAVPEGVVAQWFVTGFGVGGAVLATLFAVSAGFRARLRRSWPPGASRFRLVRGNRST